MRADVVRLLPKTDFDFSSAAGSTAVSDLVLAPNVDMSRSGAGLLIVRVHAMSAPSDSYLRLEARAVAPTNEDPAAVFRGPTVGVVQIPSGAPTGAVYQGAVQSCPGEAITLYLNLWKDKSGTFTVTLSVDLVQAEAADAWTPAALGSKLTLWLDERDLAEVSGTYTDWGDQSPAAANDFTQETGADRPASGSTINTFAAPHFDGSSDYLTSGHALSDFVAASKYHVFVVLRADAITGVSATSYVNDAVIADVGFGWWGLFLRTLSGQTQVVGFHWAGSERTAVGLGYRVTTDALIEWSYDGATIRCRVNNESAGTGSGGSAIDDITQTVQLGFGVATSVFLDGRIASVIVCNEYLSDLEAINVRTYLSSKYGVPS